MAVSNTVRRSLQNKGKARDIPLDILIQVYERGQSAWLTGSRPGIGMAQWAMARVNSFIGGSRRHARKSKDRAFLRFMKVTRTNGSRCALSLS